jgi:hypothetical protein
VWDYIKNRSPAKDVAEPWGLEWLGIDPGKRGHRRYVGHHIMTRHEVRDGGRLRQEPFPPDVLTGATRRADSEPPPR